jgi:peptidoglycan/LPS O-acetylase OafA/YrhL
MRAFDVDHAWEYASTITRADGLALGSLVALAVRSERGKDLLARLQGPIVLAASIGLGAIMARAHGLSRFEPIVQTVGYSLLAIIFAAIVAEVATPDPRGWRRALAHPALQTIGRYSYAMYVFHLPIRFAIFRYWGADLVAATAKHPLAVDLLWVLGVTLLSFGMAAVSYVILERPFLRLKERWAPQ